MEHLKLLGAFAPLVFVVLAACARTAAPPHHLRIADGGGDPSSLNPHVAIGATIDNVGSLALAYFMRYGDGGKLEPELITQIPSLRNGGVSQDGLSITWHLRHNVRWSDGAPFDARDVKFTIAAILNPRNDEAAGTEGWNEIARVETPDPYTVVYRLKEPYGALVPLSFTPVGGGPCVLPAHLLESLPDINRAPYNALPVGIGPFRIVSWKRGDAIEFEADPFYWRGMPKLRRITYELGGVASTLASRLQTGDVDLWPLVPPAYAATLRTESRLRVEPLPSLRTTHLDFAMGPGALANRAIRRAVRLAIDRRAIVRDALHGAGFITDRIVWPLAPALGDDPQVIAPNPTLAARELDVDGWQRGPGGIRVRAGHRLSLQLAYASGQPDLDEIVELLRAELRAAGIELVSRTYTHTVLFAPLSGGGILARGRFDLALYSSTLVSLPDLASNFDCASAPPRGENYTRWCDARVDAILRQMRRTYDPVEIRALFDRLDAIFIDEAPSIQLYVWRGTYAIDRRVQGYRPNVLTDFDQMMNVDAL